MIQLRQVFHCACHPDNEMVVSEPDHGPDDGLWFQSFCNDPEDGSGVNVLLNRADVIRLRTLLNAWLIGWD